MQHQLTKKEIILRNKYKPYCEICKRMIMDAKEKHRRFCQSCRDEKAKKSAEKYRKKKREERWLLNCMELTSVRDAKPQK